MANAKNDKPAKPQKSDKSQTQLTPTASSQARAVAPAIASVARA